MGHGTLYYESINQRTASLRPRLGAGCTCWAHRRQRPPIIIAEEKAEYQQKKGDINLSSFSIDSGKRGIRTPGTVTRSPHFECGPFDHSGIFPFFDAAKVAIFLNLARSPLVFFCLLADFWGFWGYFEGGWRLWMMD